MGALELTPDHPLGALRQRVSLELERNADRVATFMERETAQGQTLGAKGERGARARQQAVAGGDVTVDLEAIIKQFAPAGADVERIAELAQRFGSLAELEKYEKGLHRFIDVPGEKSFVDVFRHTDTLAGSEEERAIVRAVLAGLRERGEGEVKVEVHNHYENAKFVNPAAGSKINAESRSRNQSERMLQ